MGSRPGSHAITLKVGEFGQSKCEKGSSLTCSPGIALYWLEEEVTGWGHAVAWFRCIRARLTSPEVLHCGCGVQNVAGTYVADKLANLYVGPYCSVVIKA